MVFIFYRTRTAQGVLLWLMWLTCSSYNPLWLLWVKQACSHKERAFLEEVVAE